VSEIRLAATVILVRPGPRGIEVLVIQRSVHHRFLPGFVVFPGGAVDPEDAALGREWFGDEGDASRACALRELAEEVGLAPVQVGWKTSVAAGDAAAVVGSGPPSIADMPEISHWIAPEDVPVRFDARFYALECPRGVSPRADGAEADRAWWARPYDLLVANASGGCSLYWPTMKVMEELAGCGDVVGALSLRVPQIEPREGVFVP
jgi:8-oxo-dGTP pyrophosphatase MutT (NUDIX family)